MERMMRVTQLSILKGNVGRDPETKFTQNKTKVVTFSIATYRANPNDESKPFTDWFNCVCYGNTADIAEQHIKKGSSVVLFGKFRTRDYEKDGKKVYVTEFWVDEMAEVLKKITPTTATTDQINESGSIYEDDDLPF